MNQNEFINQEKASRDTIDVKRAYILMAGDHAAGTLLSQIVFWHLPDQEGNPNKMRIKKNSEFWIAKKREDWWDEICMLPKQFDRAIKELENRQLVKTEVFRFNGSPTKHVRLNWEIFLPVYEAIINNDKPSFDPEGGKWIFPDREYRNSRSGNIETPEQGISEIPRKPTPAVAPTLVENGPEITTEITTENIEASSINNPGWPGYEQEKNDDAFEKTKKKNQPNPVRSSSFLLGLKANNGNITPPHSRSRNNYAEGPATTVVELPPPNSPPAVGSEYMLAVDEKMAAFGICAALSAADSPLVSQLEKGGVPLKLVLAAMDEVFERNAKSKNSKKIRSFRYFVPAIQEAFKGRAHPPRDKESEYAATMRLIERLK